MKCGDQWWLVYVIEDHYGARIWLFWREEIADWVSDQTRATRYVGSAAAPAVATRLSAEQEVEAVAVRESDLI